MATMAVTNPAPKAAAMTMASKSGGNARTASETRDTTVSTKPPRHPAITPKGTPTTSDRATTAAGPEQTEPCAPDQPGQEVSPDAS